VGLEGIAVTKYGTIWFCADTTGQIRKFVY
jgi:hypothetical protein